MKYISQNLIVIFSILFIVIGCKKEVPNGPNPPDPGGNTTIPKVVVFDTTIISSKLDSIYDDGVLKFTGLSSTETPKIGDIICSAPATNAPLGFLYKVKSINKTGNTTVINTDLATIEEAVKDIEISKKINLGEYVESVTNSNGQSVPLSQVLTKSGFSSGIKFEIDNTIKFKNNISCKVKGSIETFLNLKFDLSVKSWSLKMVELSIQPQVKSSLSVAVAGEVKDSIKFHIGQINLTPITFWAGAVPIVVYPVISVDGLISSVANIEIEAKIVDIDLKYTAGAKYEEGEFSFINISESKPASFLEDVELSLSRKLKLEPQLSANFKIYNQEAYLGIFSGIYAKIETDDIKLDANIIYGLEQFNPKMKFSVGLNIGPKAKLQVFSKKIADWNPTIQLLKWELWERGMFPEFTAITFENKSQTGITAKCSMEKLSIPLLQVVEHGFCWGYGEFPTIQSDSKNQLGKVNGIGTFGKQSMKVDINGLNPGTTYTIRPFFTNRLGTFYAKSEKFTTSSASSPTVVTINPSDITLSSAKVGGNVTSAGGSNITDRGVYYSTNTVSEGTKVQIGTGTGEFSTTLSGLTPNTTYYVKAYATNSAGTSYGSILTFKTEVTAQSPTVTTSAPVNITSNSATLGGNVTSAGSSAVLERGVVYATTQNPTTSNTKITSGSGTGAYSVNSTNLTANTTYYVRAYAINTQGTAYGSEVNFSTVSAGVAPVSAFTANPTTIKEGESVQFTDLSTNNPTSWNWDFGDRNTSTLQNPSHKYSTFGKYDVKLTSSNSFGDNTVSITDYIIVNSSSGIIFNPDLTYGNVTDIEGNVYKTIQIGTQVWMAENLRTQKYRNGDPIGTTNSTNVWAENSPKYVWTSWTDPTQFYGFGGYYTFFAATDMRGVCPTNWHLPNKDEWESLITYLGGESVAGNKLKSQGYHNWTNGNKGTNSSGFTALGSGNRSASDGFFWGQRTVCLLWSASIDNSNNVWYFMLKDDEERISKLSANIQAGNSGFSVRCVKDNP